MTLLQLVLIGTATAPAAAFVVAYGMTARWWRSLMGRGLFVQAAATSLVLSLVSGATFLGPDFPGRPYVRVVVYGLITVGLWAQLITYLVTVARVRREKEN